ncbi:MAG: secondary thiamine-phosphate synthase enzyme YjbQ [Bacteroidales bacterium]|nr:secondary thiamine-phosphate synthase enzyme YjbQ [Bacteroidales bacterium]
MIYQKEFTVQARRRGFELITRQVEEQLPGTGENGILHLFMKHTSAGLTLNENADPSVRDDFESFIDQLVPENHPVYTHTMEGPDDMPAHLKSSIIGNSLTIPVTNGRMNLGTWQGIYLCEYRNHGGRRKIVMTLYT